MPENLMNSAHKAATDKYRDGYEQTFKKKTRKYKISIGLPSSENQPVDMFKMKLKKA